MSFILDALRKSEHERRRAAAPSVAQIPYAVPRARLPFWMPIAIGGLAVALAVMGFAWWYTARPAAVRAPVETLSARATQRVQSSAPQQQGSADWASPPRVGDPPPWSPPAADHHAQAAVPSNASLEAPAVQSAATAEAPAPLSDDGLPLASALASAGLVPPLTLHLLVNDADASKRFVYINNRRYAEGAYLSEGPLLLRITSRGAILRHQGRDFLLVPE